jgi:exoribonuclease-2
MNMTQENIQAGGLVLYKRRPARVSRVSEKIEIELQDGNRARVREKDVALIHPGPLENLDEMEREARHLMSRQEDVELAWQILSDPGEGLHDLEVLAELIYGAFTPASAWAAWEWLDDGIYFRGPPDAIEVCTPEEVRREQAARREREAQARAWTDFIERARSGAIDADADRQYLREVEDLALGRRDDSALLRELGRGERPENAHAFLLACAYWDRMVVPYPARLGLPAQPPDGEIPSLPEEQRLDLTHLAAYAIDDRDNQDPDDAISLEEIVLDRGGGFQSGRIWVHIADASALAPPDTPADLEARARGATLYLPDGAVPMLPLEAIEVLGMGLQEISPALSFGLRLNSAGEIVDVEIAPSWVRVGRLSYEAADQRMAEEPFRSLDTLASAYQARRRANGALFIDLPEVIVRVVDREVTIRPVTRLRSRDLVREAMLMVGEAAARFAVQHEIPFPFAAQEAPTLDVQPRDGMADPRGALSSDAEPSLAALYAMRRSLERSQVSGHPAPHAGVGLPLYSRVTSPLRRYLDLVAHQQLRAFLRGDPLVGEAGILQRLGACEAVTGSVNLAESLAGRHWKLVYLLDHPGWQGEGVLVEKRGLRGRVIIPELALEVPLHLRQDLPLDSRLRLEFKGANLPDLEAHFRVIGYHEDSGAGTTAPTSEIPENPEDPRFVQM